MAKSASVAIPHKMLKAIHKCSDTHRAIHTEFWFFSVCWQLLKVIYFKDFNVRVALAYKDLLCATVFYRGEVTQS